MRARIVISAALVGSLALLAAASPAVANEANGLSDSDGITAGASDGGDGSTASTVAVSDSGAGGQVPMCKAGDGTEGPINYRALPDNLLTRAQRDQMTADGGGWYWKYCGDQSSAKISGTTNGAVYFPDWSSGGPAPDPEDLATRALQRTPLPAPTITITPPPDKVLVNAAMWLSIDSAEWNTYSATATAGGVTSTVTAAPERVVWDMGDGQQVTCAGPGTAYDSSRDYFGQHPECGYVYRRSSAGYPGDVVSVTATIYFQVTWSASGAPGGGDLGTVSRTSAPLPVRVNEIQTVVVTGARL